MRSETLKANSTIPNDTVWNRSRIYDRVVEEGEPTRKLGLPRIVI